MDKAMSAKAAVTDYAGARRATTLHGGEPTKAELNKIGAAETKLLKAVGQLIGKMVTAK